MADLRAFKTRARVAPLLPTQDGTIISLSALQELVRRANTRISIQRSGGSENPLSDTNKGIPVLFRVTRTETAPLPAGMSEEGPNPKSSEEAHRQVERVADYHVGQALEFSIEDGWLWSRYAVDFERLAALTDAQAVIRGELIGVAAFVVLPETNEWRDINSVILTQANPAGQLVPDSHRVLVGSFYE